MISNVCEGPKGVNIYNNTPNTQPIKLQSTITGSSQAWGEQRKIQKKTDLKVRGEGSEGAPRLATKIYNWDGEVELKLGKEI